MYDTLRSLEEKQHGEYSMRQILNTYKAFVEAVIPWTPRLAAQYGEVQYYGAIDALTYEYVILTLYELGGNALLIATGEALDAAAKELVYQGGNEVSIDTTQGVTFSALAPGDRLSVIKRIKKQEILSLGDPMISDKYMIDSLIRFTMMGYYSEWYGYGSTRLDEPNQRILEFQPNSWRQVDYPGPVR